MDAKQQKEFDKVLLQRLAAARSDTVITAEEAQRLAKLFGNYLPRHPLTFGDGKIRKVPRGWVL